MGRRNCNLFPCLPRYRFSGLRSVSSMAAICRPLRKMRRNRRLSGRQAAPRRKRPSGADIGESGEGDHAEHDKNGQMDIMPMFMTGYLFFFISRPPCNTLPLMYRPRFFRVAGHGDISADHAPLPERMISICQTASEAVQGCQLLS